MKYEIKDHRTGRYVMEFQSEITIIPGDIVSTVKDGYNYNMEVKHRKIQIGYNTIILEVRM